MLDKLDKLLEVVKKFLLIVVAPISLILAYMMFKPKATTTKEDLKNEDTLTNKKIELEKHKNESKNSEEDYKSTRDKYKSEHPDS